MTTKARYVAELLDHYRQLPGTLGRVLRDDRRTAADLHQRRIDLDVVLQAFLVALARRTAGNDAHHRLPPIRTLRYFLPVIDEIARQPPDPDYLQYLRWRLPLPQRHPTEPTPHHREGPHTFQQPSHTRPT